MSVIYSEFRGVVSLYSNSILGASSEAINVAASSPGSEEDLRWGPRLGASVEFVDGLTNCGVTLFKTVEALSSGAFFFSTSVELKTKGAGGGGAGREIMDSNTSFPWILTPRHF